MHRYISLHRYLGDLWNILRLEKKSAGKRFLVGSINWVIQKPSKRLIKNWKKIWSYTILVDFFPKNMGISNRIFGNHEKYKKSSKRHDKSPESILTIYSDTWLKNHLAGIAGLPSISQWLWLNLPQWLGPTHQFSRKPRSTWKNI